MAARPLGTVTISFGLISIPVMMFSATESAGAISFNLLHKGCGSRLKQQYVCIKHETVVDRQDMVKGYEFEKGQYVQFTPEEIKAFDEIGTQSIEIAEFVAIEAIDPVYFDERSYYLTPDKGAIKPYALLTEALRQTKRCAIGRWAARGQSHLVMLRPVGNKIAMQSLRFANEVRAADDFEVAQHEVKPAELNLAKQLIEQQSADEFDPTVYVDEVRARIQAAIDEKVAGKAISVSPAKRKAEEGKVVDIMEVLKASIEKNQKAKTSVTQLGARKGPKRVEQPNKATRKTSRR
jgi:DNA end-binding protein Ku